MDKPELVARLEKAVNDGDSDAAAALFHPNAQVTIPALSGFRGTDEIRSLFEFCAGIQVNWSFEDCVVQGDSITCRVNQHDGWADGAGIAPLEYERMTLIVRDGLIMLLEGAWTESTRTALGARLETFTPWAVAHHPELYTPSGDFSYTRRAGEGFIRAMQEWLSGE